MRRRDVVTAFLRHRGRILVLKRSQSVRTHPGKWAAVSGSIQKADPLSQALQEIHEETGLEEDEIRLIRRAEPLSVPDPQNDTEWRVHPFLFEVEEPSRVRLDWEHTESRWIAPEELEKLDTVPMLKEVWQQLWRKEGRNGESEYS